MSGAITPKEPQPHNFAVSRNDLLSTLQFYFGDPAHPEKIKDFTEHHAATMHFPDAYVGQNNKLRDTLTNLIVGNVQSWMTSVALPWHRVQGINVQWDENHYDVRLLQRVPYEGVSRIQTSLRRQHRDRAVRRGIGMVIESDFYTTEVGKKHFSDNLLSIQLCVQETANFDGLFSYLTCENHDFSYEMTRGLVPRRTIVGAMRHELSMYAIVQKDGRGFDRAVEDAKARMARYHVTPNMIIIAPQLSLYVSMAPEQRINYSSGGERAVTDYLNGPKGFESQSFRGLSIFTVNPFDVGDAKEAVQMLQRSTQVGEYYVMSAPQLYNPSVPLSANAMDVILYDEEKDNMCRVGFEKALKFAMMSEVSQKINSPDTSDAAEQAIEAEKGVDFLNFRKIYKNPKNSSYQKTLQSLMTIPGADKNFGHPATKVGALLQLIFKEFFGNDASNEKNGADGNEVPGRAGWSEANFDADKFVKAMAQFNYKDPKNADRLAKAAELGVWLPIEIVLCRPFIEHQMLSTVITVAGADTGRSLFGLADMQLSANTATKVIEGHYTCHTKSVITKPQNVLIQRDIMANGYVAGCNCTFFGEHASKAAGIPPSSETATNGIGERLAFSLDYTESRSDVYESMLAFIVPFGGTAESLSEASFNITRRFLPFEVRGDSYPSAKQFPGGGDIWAAYNDLLDLDRQILAGEDLEARESRGFITGGTNNNSVCFTGPHRVWNSTTNDFTHLMPGQGHWGPDALPGDARWRRGESVSMSDARSAMQFGQVDAGKSRVFTM